MEQDLAYGQCCTRGSYYCQMEEGLPTKHQQSQTLNTDFRSRKKQKQFIGVKPEEQQTSTQNPNSLMSLKAQRFLKAKIEHWGLGVMGETDWLVLVQASAVSLHLTNLVSYILLSGVFVTVDR